MSDKKELKKVYKETMIPVGIYQIKNLVNDKVFIGGSLNLPGIINRQKFELKLGSHKNSEMQEDYRQHGEENFTFTVLDTIDTKEGPDYDYREDLNVLENMWLEKIQPYEEKGYNKKQ